VRKDIPFILIGVVLLLLPIFFIPLPVYIVALVGCVLSILSIVIYQKVLVPRMFPVKVRLWERRKNGLTIIRETRAHRITKNYQDYYQTIDGKLYKAPPKQYIVQGVDDNYVDIFHENGEYHPVTIDYESVESVKSKIIPEDQKYWLATQIEENIQATTPEKTTIEKFMPVIIIATTGIILTVMIVSFLQYFPKFVADTTGVMTSQINTLNNITQTLVEVVKGLKTVGSSTSGGQVGPLPPPH